MKFFLLSFTLITFSFNLTAKLGNNMIAPDFNLAEVVSGTKHSLSSHINQVVVLEWISPDCGFSNRHAKYGTMKGLYSKYKSRNVVWLGIDSSGEKNNTNMMDYFSWKSEQGINYPILKDITGSIGHKYEATVTPHMVIINRGKVIYQGAIDNDQFGNLDSEKRSNYVKIVLESIIEKKELPKGFKSYVRPYGCGIHYN